MIGARSAFTCTLPDYAPDARFSMDGRLLAAATVAGPVVVLDAASGAERFRTAGHVGGALSVAWNVMAPVLATGGADGSVSLYGADDGAPRARVAIGRGWVDRLAWSPDGTTLAATTGRSVCFLSGAGAVRGGFDGHPSTVTGLAWHAARRAWLTSAYGVVSMLAQGTAEPLLQHYFRTSLLTVNPSPDGRFVACGTQDPMVHVWDLEDETNEVNLTGYAGKVAVVAWHPARRVLATGAGAGIVIWDFADGDPFARPPRELVLAAGRVTAIAYLQSGELLVGTEAGLVWALDMAPDGQERARVVLGRVARAVSALVPSPHGRALVVASSGGGLELLTLTDAT
jgi:WD40 repeat protein